MRGQRKETYRPDWGTPPNVIETVLALHEGRTVMDVTRPTCAGMKPLDLKLDFEAPVCGLWANQDAYNHSPWSHLTTALFCNPPGDRRGLGVRNAIAWAAAVARYWYIPVTVALFNESALTTRAVVGLGDRALEKGGREPALVGIYRRRVRWVDPATGAPARSPPHQGALLTFQHEGERAADVMTQAGMLVCPVSVLVKVP